MNIYKIFIAPLVIAGAMGAFSIAYVLYMSFNDLGLFPVLLIAGGLWVLPGVMAFVLVK